ncbi:MAG: AMP-binding protein [Candidatus Aminicenantes bacterium]|nr:MAG: AMP-binding protein [Candidatus Aminicenantes bacterium]
MTTQNLSIYKNLVEVIQDKHTSGCGITFVEGSDNETFISYRGLYERALKILYNLQNFGIEPGHELVFQVGNNFDFVSIFWACILGHIIPIPLALAYIERHRFKLYNAWGFLDNPYLIISKNDIPGLAQFSAENKLDRQYDVIKQKTIYIEDMEKEDGKGEIYYPREEDTAFIQFSSGSTSQSKGVILTHKNLLINICDIVKGYQSLDREERMLSWVPLTHDMGIIALHMVSLVADWDQFLMPTRLFTLNPSMWLKKISEHKITYTGSTTFGYKHTLRFFDPGKNKDLDLSWLRLISTGAEPISAEICHDFYHTLAPFGLKKTAILPGYGLAEASVVVTLTEPGQEVIEVHLDRNKINIGQKVSPMGKNSGNAVTFVDVGKPVDHCSVKIVDQNHREVGEEIVGHIQVKGGNVTSGYYNNKKATLSTITPDGWVDTGDLGFLKDGRLVITGRVKDTIFVHGLTYYAHDIEFVCGELAGLKYTRTAACGVFNPQLPSEEIICFVEYKRGDLKYFQLLAAAIRKHVVKRVGAVVSRVIPVQKIPITTSGKTQRYRLKEAYLKGEFDPVLRELSLCKNKN